MAAASAAAATAAVSLLTKKTMQARNLMDKMCERTYCRNSGLRFPDPHKALATAAWVAEWEVAPMAEVACLHSEPDEETAAFESQSPSKKRFMPPLP